MKFNFIRSVLLLFFVFAFDANAFIVTNVTIYGYKNIEISTIEKHLKIKKGDNFDITKIEETIASLYSTNFFSNVEVKNSGTEVEIFLTEEPLVVSLEIQGAGKEGKEIVDKLSVKRGHFLKARDIENDKNGLIISYKKGGYLFADVQVEIKKLHNNRVNVVFNINKGDKPYIKNINIIGNKNISSGTIKNFLISKEIGVLSFINGSGSYNIENLNSDKESLKLLYRSRGYYDIKVLDIIPSLDVSKKYFNISYLINEGEQYKISDFVVENNVVDIDINQIKKMLPMDMVGQVLNGGKLRSVIYKLQNTLSKNRNSLIVVNYDILRNETTHSQTIKILVNYDKGLYLSKLDITGNDITDDKVIRKNMELDEGDIVTGLSVDNFRRKLYGLDFFSDVDITATQDKSNGYDLLVKVVEKSTTSGKVGITGGSEGVFFDLSYNAKNFLGNGTPLSVMLKVNQKQIGLDFDHIYPDFLDEDVSLSTKIFTNWMFTDSIFGSESKKHSDDIESGKQNLGLKETIYVTLSDDFMVGYFYSLKLSKLNEAQSKSYPSRPYYFEDAKGDYITSSIGANVIFNNTDRRRDSLSISGVSGNVMFEGAGFGGYDRYFKSSLAVSFYKSFFDDDVIFKLHNTVEHISGLNSRIRIPNRLSLGDKSFRGFADYGLGPRYKENNEFAGGNFSWTSSLDMLFSIPVTEDGSSFGLNGILFAEVGNLYGDWTESGRELLTQDNGFRMSAGFGVMIRNPILPCIIYYGVPMRKSDYDHPFSISFKLGYSF